MNAEKKIEVVTGASRGIGRAIALELAAKGAFVVINYNGSKEKAEAVKAEIIAAGGAAETSQCNVSDFDACGAFIKETVKKYGQIDILVIISVHNAESFDRICRRSVFPDRTHFFSFCARTVVNNITAHIDKHFICVTHISSPFINSFSALPAHLLPPVLTDLQYYSISYPNSF